MAPLTIGTLLLVDDDAMLRAVLAAHLRYAGFDVREADNGRTCLDLAAELRPDLIVMDVAMPVMDGIEATRRLKAEDATRDIPVIMLTASARSEDLVVALETGAQEYVRKPFEMSELLARVRTVHRLVLARRELDSVNQRLEDDVRVKTGRLQTLYDCMRDLNRADSRPAILDRVIRAVQDVSGARHVSILLVDSSDEYLVCERAAGVDPSVVKRIRVSAVEDMRRKGSHGGGILGAALQAAGVDGRKYDRDAFVVTPLETPGGILGIVNATGKPDDAPFTHEEIECIGSIADAAAIALDNAQRRDELARSVRVLLATIGHLAEYRDEETTLHLERVAKITGILARQLARAGEYRAIITDEFVDMIVQAAPLHDIGKVGIPDDILTKAGKLTHEEFQIMKTHTDIGRRVLSMPLDPQHPVPLLEMCIDIAFCHHERFNGMGYPRRVAGDAIPLPARIVAVVDVYDAMTSRRRYKRERSHDDALRTIREERGEHFDPVIVDAFLACHEEFDAVRARYADTPETVAAGA